MTLIVYATLCQAALGVLASAARIGASIAGRPSIPDPLAALAFNLLRARARIIYEDKPERVAKHNASTGCSDLKRMMDERMFAH